MEILTVLTQTMPALTVTTPLSEGVEYTTILSHAFGAVGLVPDILKKYMHFYFTSHL
jgi:hypothetical protein